MMLLEQLVGVRKKTKHPGLAHGRPVVKIAIEADDIPGELWSSCGCDIRRLKHPAGEGEHRVLKESDFL